MNGCVFYNPVAGVTVTGLRCPVATMCQCDNGQFVGEKSAPRDLGDSQSLFLLSLAMVTTVTSRLNGCPEHEHCMIFEDFIAPLCQSQIVLDSCLLTHTHKPVKCVMT